MSNLFNFEEIFAKTDNTEYLPAICLTDVSKISESSGPFLQSLKKTGYDKFQDGVGDDRFKKMVITILNGIYTQNRLIFGLSKRKFREMASKDLNWGPNGLEYDSKIWKRFILYITSQKIVKVLNPEVRGSNAVFLYELIQPDFVKLFNNIDKEAQKKEVDLFLARYASQSSASQLPSHEVHSTKSTTSTTNRKTLVVENKKEEVEEDSLFNQEEKILSNDWNSGKLFAPMPPGKNVQLQTALVKTTKRLDTSYRHWELIEQKIDIADLSLPAQRLFIEKFSTFGESLRQSLKSSSQTIEQKVDAVMTLVSDYGAHRIPKQVFNDLVEQRHREIGEKFDNAARKYYDTIETKYNKAMKPVVPENPLTKLSKKNEANSRNSN